MGQHVGRGFGKNESEWTGKAEIKTRKKFMALDETHEAIFSLTPDFNGRTSVSSEFSTEGAFIFASAILNAGQHGRDRQRE